jgi:hypothetical protein
MNEELCIETLSQIISSLTARAMFILPTLYAPSDAGDALVFILRLTAWYRT